MNKESILFAAPLRSRSGYGNRSRDVARSLYLIATENDYSISYLTFSWGSTPDSAPLDDFILDNLLETEDFIHLQEGGYTPDIFIHCTIPNEFNPIGRFNIGLTAGIETNVCHPDWINGCNRMDLVLTSSEHSKKVFEESKFPAKNKQTGEDLLIELKTKCEVLFEGIDIFNFRRLTKKGDFQNDHLFNALKEIPTDFNFLFVGHWLQGSIGNDRKDIGMLIYTFIRTFMDVSVKNRPSLILKTSLGGFSKKEQYEIEGRISDIKQMMRRNGIKGKFPKIYVLHGDLTDLEMNELYNHPKVSAMVSFTKGEGFGRPLLEFTTTGKPVLASGWSGQTDFLHPDYSFQLPGSHTPVHPSAVNNWIIRGSKWFTVNYKYAANMMKNMVKHYSSYTEMSRKHKKYTKDNFTFEKMTEVLSDYILNREKYTNKVVHKKLNIPDISGIFENNKSKELDKKFNNNEE